MAEASGGEMHALGGPTASAQERIVQAAPKLRADENRGTLMADQQPHVLDEARLRGGSSDSWATP
jgi:hypothetical protein